MKGTGAKRVCPGSCVSTGAKFPVAPVQSAPMLSGSTIIQTIAQNSISTFHYIVLYYYITGIVMLYLDIHTVTTF